MIALAATLLALGAWAGTILFQSAVNAPVVFTTLDSDGARRFLRKVFPRFFQVGIAFGVVALAGLVTGAPLLPGRSLAITLLLAMVLANALALALIPAVNRAADEGAGGKTRFKRLHGATVILTLGVLAGCIFLTFSIVGGLGTLTA